MDEYKTRLYAIACRAPITEVHMQAVEQCPLYTQYRQRVKELNSRTGVLVNSLNTYFPWSKNDEFVVTREYGHIINRRSYYKHVWNEDCWAACRDSFMDFTLTPIRSYRRAKAAIAYAETVIDTPSEYLVMSLPVDGSTSRSILSLRDYAQQMQECIDGVFDEEELSSLEALVETMVQEAKEQKERVREEITTPPSTTVVKQEEEGYNNVFPAALTFLGLLGLALYLIF